jgi:hypothetical protein
MATDLDAFIKMVEGLDEGELHQEIGALREELRRVSLELNKRLDALTIKQRWDQEQRMMDGGAMVDSWEELRDRVAHGQAGAYVAPERRKVAVPPDSGSNGGTADFPRGIAAVREIMRDGGNWTIERLFEEMRRREWVDADVQHPRKALETAVSRLAKRGEIVRVGRGKYRPAASPQEQTSSQDGPDLVLGPARAEP